MNKILLIFLTFTILNISKAQSVIDSYGVLTRSDTSKKQIYLCFTGHDYFEGFEHVLDVLNTKNVKASFFLTGDFIRNHTDLVKSIALEGHYIGAHSDQHLLYCDWNKRDSLLHSPKVIKRDIKRNLKELKALGLYPKYFMHPYEWYNQKVVDIARKLKQESVNFSPGTRSNADYTTPDMSNYISSDEILTHIYNYEQQYNLNGFHLLIHPGTNPNRTDKLYLHIESLIINLRAKGYQFSRF